MNMHVLIFAPMQAQCNTALPIFIDAMLNPGAAIAISVTAIFIFGEVMPQAVGAR